MDEKKEFLGLTAQQIKSILASPQAKELIRRLNQNGGQTLKKASEAAKRGDYGAVEAMMAPLMQDEKAAALAEQLRKKQD